MKRAIFVLQLLACCLFLGQHTAQATEGASSYYFPGASGSFAVAVAPDPGFMFANQMLFYNAKASEAVLRGHAHLEVKADAFYNYFGAFYTFQEPIVAGRFQLGATVPFAYVHIKAGRDGCSKIRADRIRKYRKYGKDGNNKNNKYYVILMSYVISMT